jgi:hypothetical protein
VSPRTKPGAADLLTDRVRDHAVNCAPHELRKDLVLGGLPLLLSLLLCQEIDGVMV